MPAKRTNLNHKKGEIRLGNDADLVIWRPDSAFDIQVSNVHFKNKLSPYVGKSFYGVVDQTIVRGQTVYERQSLELFAKTPVGQPLLN